VLEGAIGQVKPGLALPALRPAIHV
jgi:hypothetical protein